MTTDDLDALHDAWVALSDKHTYVRYCTRARISLCYWHPNDGDHYHDSVDFATLELAWAYVERLKARKAVREDAHK